MKNNKFHQFIIPLKDKLYRLALGIVKDEKEAEDIVQDILIKLWQRNDELEFIDNLEAYCYRSTRNLSLDRLALRNSRRINSIDKENEDRYFVDDQSPDKIYINNEHISLINDFISKLSESYQMVLHLREIENMSYKDIASIMEISEDQVKINLFRARKKLKDQFENYFKNED